MPRSARALALLSLFVVSVVSAGCGGSEADAPDESTPEAVTDVTITPVGNQMKYEQTELTVPAGEEITLTSR